MAMDRIVIYHGSDHIIEKPLFGVGNVHNDYGQAFYCTSSLEMAKEWANKTTSSGFANKYQLDGRGLSVLDLTSSPYGVMNWMAILMHHRAFSAATRAMYRKRLEFLETHFYVDIKQYDVVIGYRADDAYFKFPMLFIQNELSIDRLEEIYRLGNLGKQIAIISEKAFSKLKFLGAVEVEASWRERYLARKSDADARFEEIRVEELNGDKMRIDEYMKHYDQRQ